MLGFTKQELHIVQFLVVALLLGSGVRVYKHYFSRDKLPQINAAQVQEFVSRSAQIDSARNLPDKSSNMITVVDVTNEPRQSKKEGGTADSQKAPVPSGSPTLVDINHAGDSELQQIPKIGPVLAKRILAYREANGEFKSVDDLLQVSGIGKKTLESMMPYIVLK